MASEGTGAPAGYTKWEELQVPLEKRKKTFKNTPPPSSYIARLSSILLLLFFYIYERSYIITVNAERNV